MQGLIGQKLGMTQVYDENGHRVAVTVIETGPCSVLQRKTRERDGYDAVQLGFGVQKEHRVRKPLLSRAKQAKVAPPRCLREFALDGGDGEDGVNVGDTLTAASVFEGVTHVDICGVSKGRGFQGVVKRHGMRGGPKTHGGHSKRRVGAIGQCSYPARVAKGQALPGHMGHRRVTVQNLKLVAVRGDENVILVRGAVPGPNGSILVVRKALKKR
jgi:large subunit ribosomal protein L3